MKTIIALLLITAFCYNMNGQSVPNGDFESGIDTVSLNHWHTINELTVIFYPFTRTTDSYSGDYAVKLKTLEIFNTLVPGIATLGKLSIGDVSGSIYFPYRPDKLTGMYKHPTDKDASLIRVYFLKKQGEKSDTIGMGSFVPNGNIEEYKAFEIEINYNSAAVPDSMNIILISDGEVANSTFYIDNLEFVYNTNSIEKSVGSSIEVYPNPTNSFVNIKANGFYNKKYVLSNLYGRIVASGNVYENFSIDLSNEATGMYFLAIENKIYKIIKN